MNYTNQTILNAVIEKAKQLPCPSALIGIYGSVNTLDEHEKSDLDLLILTDGNPIEEISRCFIVEDCGVGYDLYCTSWDRLRFDAECRHAKLAKLFDSEIVLINDEAAYQELLRLRKNAKDTLNSPARFERVNDLLTQAKICYANAALSESLGEVRYEAFGVINFLADAFMLYHGCYFKRGTKQMLNELSALPIDQSVIKTMRAIALATSISALRTLTKELLLFAQKALTHPKEKEAPSKNLAGTYEEIVSNWKNKVTLAAKENDAFSSFMNMGSLHGMMKEIADGIEIGSYNLLETYDPSDLTQNVKAFEQLLEHYESIYSSAGITVKRYPSADAFALDYLK